MDKEAQDLFTGSSQLRAYPVKIYKATPENSPFGNPCPCDADGTVQIDKSKCIGCQFCAMACPYGVRYLNEEERVVEKCTLCQQKTAQGELPQCVAQCGSRARFFGDVEQGWESFVAPGRVLEYEAIYDDMHDARVSMLECVRPFQEGEVHYLPEVGNGPSCAYILHGMTWQGEE